MNGGPARSSMAAMTTRPPSRWAVRAAHLVSLVVLPSALWRLGLVFGFSMGGVDQSGDPIDGP